MESVYCSGWQVAADANTNGQTYPDQSLYSVDSVPRMVKRINNALVRAEQIESLDAKPTDSYKHWLAPIVADAEAGFGGALNVFELTKALIEAGAAAIHFEEQLSSAKKCGHMHGKVLIPTRQHIQTLIAARLAADVCDVPTVIIARTDALSGTLLTSDIDERDQPFIDQSVSRTSEGFYRLKGRGLDRALARALAYAPYADMLWVETSEPNIDEAEEFAQRIHAEFPGKLLAYNLSPSFAWSKKLDASSIVTFQSRLGELGYKYQFVTLANWHSNALSSYKLGRGFAERGMPAYVELQDEEFELEPHGYTAVKHQREASVMYYDEVQRIIGGADASTLAFKGSTEDEQF